jgi:hypothetical protein
MYKANQQRSEEAGWHETVQPEDRKQSGMKAQSNRHLKNHWRCHWREGDRKVKRNAGKRNLEFFCVIVKSQQMPDYANRSLTIGLCTLW